MSGPLSTKREQQIRDLPKLIRRNAWTAAEDAADAIRDLTAELDRLRVDNARLRVRLEGKATGGWIMHCPDCGQPMEIEAFENGNDPTLRLLGICWDCRRQHTTDAAKRKAEA